MTLYYYFLNPIILIFYLFENTTTSYICASARCVFVLCVGGSEIGSMIELKISNFWPTSDQKKIKKKKKKIKKKIKNEN